MLKLSKILHKTVRAFLFVLVMIEIVVIYNALISEFSNLIIGCFNFNLIKIGYLFSVEGLIKFIIKLIPFSLLIPFFKIEYTKRENIIKFFGLLYNKFTTLQLIICFVTLSLFLYFLNKFYGFFYNKYKQCL